MTIANILYTILISPIQLFFEFLYMIAYDATKNPGLSIIALSLAMNLLVLPLYRRADALQEEERDMDLKLRKGVKHIKKTFRGDVRMMILQTYYRQNHYKPLYVFRGALSLFLEIPFFIAAYQFLSRLAILQGVSFGVIKDLGAPDKLLSFRNMQVNLLPVIMTAVNLLSCVIFTKGYPAKTKIQLYFMALFFFFFLYSSPSGLVFYWTLNNVFSLVKTIFYKLRHSRLILCIMAAMFGAAVIGHTIATWNGEEIQQMLTFIVFGAACLLPVIVLLFQKLLKILLIKIRKKPLTPWKPKLEGRIFHFGVLFLAVLLGCVIPSAIIHASPQEFVDVFYYLNPLWFVCSSFCFAAGAFLVWFGVFYKLAGEKGKAVFQIIVWLLCGMGTVNYLFFGNKLGLLRNTLVYHRGLYYTLDQEILNMGILLALLAVMLLCYRWLRKWISQILMIGFFAFLGMSVYNMAGIQQSVSTLKEATKEAGTPSFPLSKTGKNVVVIMMDRAVNPYIPYIMQEKPKLKEQFAGFTYYPNTISFGLSTNYAAPAFYGGYEYTPYEMNKRDTVSLRIKHNEALKIMPVLFDSNGYDVTVCDPTYANYQWMPDLSIYDDYPDIHTFITQEIFQEEDIKRQRIQNNKRNFFCYSIVRVMPLVAQHFLYNDGQYFQARYILEEGEKQWKEQVIKNKYKAEGINADFLAPYRTLQNFTTMTRITEEETNTFMMISNDTTHNSILMQEPEYVLSEQVDNTAYEKEHADRFTIDGKKLKMDKSSCFAQYQSIMATLLLIGDWLDDLRSNGVYDNTRIILSADHGRSLKQFDNLILDAPGKTVYDAQAFYPLLMVKDFGAKEFTTSEEFMTNADVPTLAMKDIIPNPVNPFTGKEINSQEKFAHDQYVIDTNDWQISENNGNTFLPGDWFSVQKDMRKKENWTFLRKNAIMPFD